MKVLPHQPAVYALYGAGRDVAYVGIASKSVKDRITQHLVRRDSSITTGVSIVSLNAELVRRVEWWLHPRFTESAALEAAELVAFDVFEPTMRSRGAVGKAAFALAAEETVRREFTALFEGQPTGRLDIPALPEVMERLEAINNESRRSNSGCPDP